MKITFETPIEVVVVKELKRTINEVTIKQIVDNPSSKSVIAQTLEVGQLTLWKDEAYDTIGQWTDADVIAKVTELLG